MKNFRLEIAGVEMQMGDGSLSLQINNPMFEEVGSHSLPVKIPRTPHNDSALQGFHPGSISTTQRFSAKVFLGAVPYPGEFVASKRSDAYYEGYFTTGNSTFRDKVSTKKLTDIDYTESIIGPVDGRFTDELDNAAAGSYPTYNYTCFPIRTPQFFDPYEITFNTMMNPWSFEHLDPSSLGFVKHAVQRFAPSFYLCFVISEVFASQGYAIESNDLVDDDELKTLVVTNFNSGYMDYTTLQYDLKFSGALPEIYINDFILGLENLFNIAFFINDQSNTVVIKKKTDIIKSLPTRKLSLVGREVIQSDRPDGFSLEYTMDQDDSFAQVTSIDGMEVALTVANVEDLSGYPAGNYLFKLAKISNHDLYYYSKMTPSNPGGWDWESYDGDETGQTVGVTLESEDDLEVCPAESFPYQLARIPTGMEGDEIVYDYYRSEKRNPVPASWEWELYSKDYHGYSEGEGELEIKTEVNPVLTTADQIEDIYSNTEYKEHAILPRVDNSSINSFGWQEFKSFDSLRLLFYRGIVPSGGNIYDPTVSECDYPLATPDVYRPNSSVADPYGRIKITEANQSLRWGGTYGLYNTHWKDYLYWFLNIKREAVDYYDMTLKEFLSIRLWEKYQAGDQSVLFRTINLQVDFSSDSISVGECKVYLS